MLDRKALHLFSMKSRKDDVRLPEEGNPDSWREAGPPNHHDDEADSDQWVVNTEPSLSQSMPRPALTFEPDASNSHVLSTHNLSDFTLSRPQVVF